MARYTGADCRLCRREGAKLFLKGDRCYTDKCAIERRNYAPGEAGKKRIKESEYRLQLREKQKTKRIYGVLEKQFRGYYDMANRSKGVTGENLLRILESRLDNVVYRLGFAKSRAEARQQVRHGHITVNGRRVDIPSFRVRPGDLVAVAPKAKDLLVIKSALISNERVQVPAWLEVDIEKLQGKMCIRDRRVVGDLLPPPRRDRFEGGEARGVVVERLVVFVHEHRDALGEPRKLLVRVLKLEDARIEPVEMLVMSAVLGAFVHAQGFLLYVKQFSSTYALRGRAACCCEAG